MAAIMTSILGAKTDDEISSAIGGRLRGYRLLQNITIEEMANRTGLSRNTIVNAESGKNPRLSTLVRLLRAYGRLENLESLFPAPTISPLQLLRTKGRVRKRAGRRG